MKPRHAVAAFLAIILTIVIADQTCSHLLRPIFERPRPNNPASPVFGTIFKIRESGGFGFPSCHGANTLGLAFIIMYIFKEKRLTLFFLVWAAITAYSRIYIGFHYPGDILGGWAVGFIAATVAYALFKAAAKDYTRTDGVLKYRNLPVYAGCTTVAFIIVKSLFA